MPKIFALRDRLQAVQDYLIDTEDELQIFPGKHFPQPPPKQDLKCPIALGERNLNTSLVEDNVATLENQLIAESHFLDIDDIGHQEEVFTTSENKRNQSHENLTDGLICQPEDESKMLIPDEYQKQSAIETSLKEIELPEESQENSDKVLNGKLNNSFTILKLSILYRSIKRKLD